MHDYLNLLGWTAAQNDGLIFKVSVKTKTGPFTSYSYTFVSQDKMTDARHSLKGTRLKPAITFF